MEWAALAQLALVVSVIVAQIPAVRRQWLEDRAGTKRTVKLLAYYFAYIAIGFGVLLSVIHGGGRDPLGALAAVAFMLAWVLLGTSWLIKLVPRYRPLPDWVLKPYNVLDKLALATIAIALVVLFG